VVAARRGYCLAGGSELATAGDVVFAAEDAQIGYPGVRLMSPPDMPYHPWLVGMRRAMEIMGIREQLDGRDAAFGDYRRRPS
jgi:enoyl-CoA hydratase